MNDHRSYIKICQSKLLMAFGEVMETPKEGFVPFAKRDPNLYNKIERFFGKNRRWQEISLNDIKLEFKSDYDGIFYHLGWSGLKSATPLLLNLSYEHYLEGDTISEVAESVFTSFPRDVSDEASSFSQWINSYDRYQVTCILDFLSIAADESNGYGDIRALEGARWWTSRYLDTRYE